MTRTISEKTLGAFQKSLEREERSEHTIGKYIRDVRAFANWAGGRAVTKELVISYKERLQAKGYTPESVNTMLSSLNSLFRFLGWRDCRVRSLRCQRRLYCPEERELSRSEYERLVSAAERSQNKRLTLLLQTLCGTGIRVSELPYITVEAAERGEAVVNCKGKTRPVFLVKGLRRLLLAYARRQGIQSGPIFVTRSGRPIDRTNVWREMKSLCRAAGVDPRKVFPHNLRHLFARVFYRLEKDLSKLADILGHSSIETTRLYIISTGSEHRARLEQMRLIV